MELSNWIKGEIEDVKVGDEILVKFCVGEGGIVKEGQDFRIIDPDCGGWYYFPLKNMVAYKKKGKGDGTL